MEGTRNSIKSIVQSLCTSGSSILDKNDLKCLKSYCKQNDENIKICYEFILSELKKSHSEIRLSAFQLCDELFMRSHLFRQLMLEDFQLLFELVLETNRAQLMPPPKQAAYKLKQQAAKSIKNWHTHFGHEYKLLELGFKYLKNIKKIDFDTFNTLTLAERQTLDAANKKQEFFLNQECLQFIKELNESEQEIRACLTQFDNCFSILIPRPFDFLKNTEQSNDHRQTTQSSLANNHCDCTSESEDDDEDNEFIEVKIERTKEDTENEMRYLGFLSNQDSEYVRHFAMDVNVKFNQNEENLALIENMTDFYKELKNTHLEKVKKWIKTFSSVNTSMEPLKKSIELKNDIQASLKKFDDLGIKIDDCKKFKEDSKNPKKIPKIAPKPRILNENTTNNELFKIAPILDLNEIHLGVSLSSKVEADNKWYTKNDTLDERPSFNANTLLKKTFIGTFKPVKWKCLTSMPNGNLCQRMDRFKCPFHGKIIARDKLTGKAVNEQEEKERLEELRKRKQGSKEKSKVTTEDNYLPGLDDPSLICDIEAATGQNLSSTQKRSSRKCRRLGGNLTKISDFDSNTSRKRLENRVLSMKSIKKVGGILDGIDRRLNSEKFHHNFNYSINS